MENCGMYQLFGAKGPLETEWLGPYVHSKTWIFDDAYAIVGSANCQRRCYSHDSELVVGVADDDQTPMKNKILFDHELRMALWRNHLGLHQENLWDPISATKTWKSPPASALIAPYDPNEVNNQAPDKNLPRVPSRHSVEYGLGSRRNVEPVHTGHSSGDSARAAFSSPLME